MPRGHPVITDTYKKADQGSEECSLRTGGHKGALNLIKAADSVPVERMRFRFDGEEVPASEPVSRRGGERTPCR